MPHYTYATISLFQTQDLLIVLKQLGIMLLSVIFYYLIYLPLYLLLDLFTILSKYHKLHCQAPFLYNLYNKFLLAFRKKHSAAYVCM